MYDKIHYNKKKKKKKKKTEKKYLNQYIKKFRDEKSSNWMGYFNRMWKLLQKRNSFKCIRKKCLFYSIYFRNQRRKRHSHFYFMKLVCIHAQSLSHVWLFATLWTLANEATVSMGFSRQEYWNGLPFPPPRDIPDPGIKSESPASLALSGILFTPEPPGKPCETRITWQGH